MNRITYLRNELAIARRRLTSTTEAAQRIQNDLEQRAVAAGETIAELDAAVVDLEYRNALLTLGVE